MAPMARVAAAAGVLGLYYWLLFASPFATSPAAVDAAIDRDIAASRALFEAGRFADALPPSERLTNELPSQVIFHERLARIYHALNRFGDEAGEWQQVMALSPTPVDACPMVAEAHARAGDSARELAALERCASLPPVNPDFLLMLGQALVTRDRTVEARQAFERGLDVGRDYPDLHLLLGIRQFADGERAAARRNFERFLQLAPSRRQEVAVWLQRTADVP
jgi:tetratricopeptide (TPR) repeat protein